MGGQLGSLTFNPCGERPVALADALTHGLVNVLTSLLVTSAKSAAS